jgi:hypothetical protein
MHNMVLDLARLNMAPRRKSPQVQENAASNQSGLTCPSADTWVETVHTLWSEDSEGDERFQLTQNKSPLDKTTWKLGTPAKSKKI